MSGETPRTDTPTQMLVLSIEVPGMWADDMTEEWCRDQLDGEFTPMEVFAESFDEDAVLTLLWNGPGEDPARIIARECKVVGVSTRPLRESEVPR